MSLLVICSNQYRSANGRCKQGSTVLWDSCRPLLFNIKKTPDSGFFLFLTCRALRFAGLIYKHYGKDLIANMMKLPADHPDVQTVYLQVYKNFIEAVDAIDNGVKQYDTDAPTR